MGVLVAAGFYLGRVVNARPKLLGIGVVFLLGILGFFKYKEFLITNFNLISPLSIPSGHRFALPLGISFIIFQIIAYLVDVKRETYKDKHSFLDVILFISFFPHMIAGPICRPHQLIPQIQEQKMFQFVFLWRGIFLFSAGLMLKAVFADGMSSVVDRVFAMDTVPSFAESLGATLGYGIQILADFWGYSTMALGCAWMFGIRLPVNFNNPYGAKSLSEFWQRWHITLSSWLRDYLYVSMGGNRKGEIRTYLNMIVTMLLGGLWHGANWTFVVWGGIHGITQALFRFIEIKFASTLSLTPRFAKIIVGLILTQTIVHLAWIFFRAPDFLSAKLIFLGLFGGGTAGVVVLPKDFLILVCVFYLALYPLNKLIIKSHNGELRGSSEFFMSACNLLLVVILAAPESPKFIYFDF